MSVNQISSRAPLVPLKVEKLTEVSKEDGQKLGGQKLRGHQDKLTASDPISSKQLDDLVVKGNDFLKITKTHLRFEVREGFNKYYVEIRDSVTDEVIKEIPPKKLLDMMTKIQELAGLIVDETI